MKKIKAYKVFNSDFKCKEYQFEVGKEYQEKDAIACQIGFHACIDINDCWNYYSFDSNNRVAIVELWGKVDDSKKDKTCATHIKIVKELTWSEVLDICNTGSRNAGYGNAGSRNAGSKNAGTWNAGSRNAGSENAGYGNAGSKNAGSWNAGSRNAGTWNAGYGNAGSENAGSWNAADNTVGYFNSKTPQTIKVFNKKCKKEVWKNANKPDFIYDIQLNEWIYWSAMTNEEKELNKDAYVCRGYLKTHEYKEAWQNAYNKASKEDIELLKALPNFDSEVFEEITGIKVD